MQKLRIIVSGFIGLYPAGGVAWDYIQYPLGLLALGHDVYYIEDTSQYPVFHQKDESWDDATSTIKYLEQTMQFFGLQERWAYIEAGSGRCHGLSISRFKEVCATADIFINVSAATYPKDEYANIPARILIDSDPMFTQIQDLGKNSQLSEREVYESFKWYNQFFSFGENIGASDCQIPTLDLHWQPTRQPVCLDYWKYSGDEQPQNFTFSTIMNWSIRNPIVYKNKEWGQKDVEFNKILSLPSLDKSSTFQIALAISKNTNSQLPLELLTNAGWQIINANDLVFPNQYALFIRNSAAEFSVAKNAYVQSNSGWFSCRSACYLASGRPVVTQETGWSKFIPAGEGLLSFTDLNNAYQSVEVLKSNYKKHCRAARDIAEDYFDSSKVLKSLINSL